MKAIIINLKVMLLACFTFLSCNESPPKEDTSITLDTTSIIPYSLDTLLADEVVPLADTTPQTVVEEIIEDGKLILEAGKELLNEKRKNDSIRLSKREKMYAYQLGLPCKNQKLLLEAYKKLSDLQSVYALKKDRNEYLLVKYEDKSEEQLCAELDTYKEAHANEIIGTIKVIDLFIECGKRKKPILSGKIKKRRDDTQIDCLTCDN
jgi:hypothetical protein